MRRWAAALGPLAVACVLTACSSSAAGSSPASPGPFASQADQVMADLAAGNFTAVQAKFDPAMIKAAQAVPLPKAWAACQDALGTYRNHGRADVYQDGPIRPRTGARYVGQRAGRDHHHLPPRRDN